VLAVLLADGRLPAGSYAHSLGLEEAVHQGWVADAGQVAAYTSGALSTVGVGAAALAVAAWRLAADDGGSRQWRCLDAEADARMPSPVQRRSSRQLGRHLVRLAAAFGPQAVTALEPAAAGNGDGPHQALATGALAAGLDLSAADAALLCLYGTASVVTQAAVRLLGLDPLFATAVVAEAAPWIAATAAQLAAPARSTRAADPGQFARAAARLPAPAAPLVDHALACHDQRPERLFAT
jgi:urease accessory protein